jgi:hypothetical protein
MVQTAAHRSRLRCKAVTELRPGENIRVSEPGSHSNELAPTHRFRRLSGRDPHGPHRVATPLELLFDLTFVIAFGVAASQFAQVG